MRDLKVIEGKRTSDLPAIIGSGHGSLPADIISCYYVIMFNDINEKTTDRISSPPRREHPEGTRPRPPRFLLFLSQRVQRTLSFVVFCVSRRRLLSVLSGEMPFGIIEVDTTTGRV
jgi:hypothetical protein